MSILCPYCQHSNPDSHTQCESCMMPLTVTQTQTTVLPPGTPLQQGKYRVGKVLGQGGFAIAYMASDTLLRIVRAIKEFFPYGARRNAATVLPPGNVTQADFDRSKLLFLNEAKLIAQLNHPHIIKVFDAFEENNTAYYVMEYIGGKSLKVMLDESKGPLNERDVIDYILQICMALEVLHARNIIHRDIKPHNILISPDRQAVLIDFGAAKHFLSGQSQALSGILTPEYAPLELYGTRARIGPYSDIYCLGATLYHLLTGSLPPRAPERVAGILLEPPRKINPRISKNTEEAILWALEIEAPKRPQTVHEFASKLLGKAAKSKRGPRMIICRNPSCKKPNLMGQLYCEACGEQLTDPASNVTCPNCRLSIPKDANFCVFCGAKQTP